MTCNELYGLNSYIVNRPGRFHYHFRFDYPAPDDIREYLCDKLEEEFRGEIEKVVDFSRTVSLSYDCLRSIAFELNSGNSFASAVVDLNIMTTEDEEYNVHLFFENGRSLHHLKYSTNLYDDDGLMTRIALYDDDGHYMISAYYDKQLARYDAGRDAVIIPAEGIKIDGSSGDDGEDDERESSYRKFKPKYMTFTKRRPKNLHYLV